MVNKRQFSLAYLFLEVFWFAASLGMACQALRLPPPHDDFTILLILFFISGSFVCFGAAIGGLFHKMRIGAGVAALWLFGLGVLFLLALGPLIFFFPPLGFGSKGQLGGLEIGMQPAGIVAVF
jgi:hypothetical protein